MTLSTKLTILAGFIAATFASLVLYPPSAHSQETICMRRVVPVNARNRVALRRFIRVREECNRREIALWTGPSAAVILERLREVDGSGSLLDADFLDGFSSDHFATSAATQELAENITVLNTNVTSLSDTLQTQGDDIEALEQSTTTLEGTTNTLSNSLTNLSSDVTAQRAQLDGLALGNNVVRVGEGDAQFTNLEDAIDFVAAQARDADNRYVVLLGAGTFEVAESIAIPSFTEIQGISREGTIVHGAPAFADPDIFVMTFSTALSNLTVLGRNSGAIGFAGVDPNPANPEDPTTFSTMLTNVRVENTTDVVAAKNLIFWDDTNSNISVLIRNSEIIVGAATGSNRGVMLNSQNASAFIYDTAISASGSNATAVLLNNDTDVRIFNSRLRSAGTSLLATIGNAVVRNSELINTSALGSGLLLSGGNPSVSVYNSLLSATFSAVSNSSGSLSIHSSALRATTTGVSTSGAAADTVIHSSTIDVSGGAGVGLAADNNGAIVVSSSRIDAITAATVAGGGSATCSFITNGDGDGFAAACGVI